MQGHGGHGKNQPYLQAFPQMPVGTGLVASAPVYAGLMTPGLVGPGMMFQAYPPFAGHMPADLARGYSGFAPMGLPQDMDSAAALSDRLADLHLGGMGGGARGRIMPQGAAPYPARGGVAGPSGYPAYSYGPASVQQGGRGQPRGQGGRGRGQGPLGGGALGGRGQQPKKGKRSQKGMEDNVKRTVYISYVDHQVTEEALAAFFSDCGKVLDCRICGDPNSAMRFAFIEFSELESAAKALEKSGSILGNSPLRVLPSKTAIMPVNRELMPRSSDEIERCSRTVYAANIDKKVDRNDVRAFFESLCGKVSRIRLLGDYAHATRIAFVEFIEAEGALAALNCSGALLGSLPIRVSPSKTPVRVDNKESGQDGSSSTSSAAAQRDAQQHHQQQPQPAAQLQQQQQPQPVAPPAAPVAPQPQLVAAAAPQAEGA